MINILKEIFYKWLSARCLAKVEAYGLQRLALKDKQVLLREQAAIHSDKVKELKRIAKQA